MAGYCNAGLVESTFESRDKGFDVGKVVNDKAHIFDAGAPIEGCTWSGCREREGLRAKMSWLDDHEAVGGPEVCERTVAIQGREVVGHPMAVGEKYDGKVGATYGC